MNPEIKDLIYQYVDRLTFNFDSTQLIYMGNEKNISGNFDKVVPNLGTLGNKKSSYTTFDLLKHIKLKF